jgi:hypothetical protein
VDGQICRSDGCAVCCLLQNSILHIGRGPQAAQRCWWVHFGCSQCVDDSYDNVADSRMARSRLAVVDAKAQDEAACAGSKAVWTLVVAGMDGGSWEGKARSLQLPIVRIHPTPPQAPATDLCLAQWLAASRTAMVGTGGCTEGMGVPGGELGWLLR